MRIPLAIVVLSCSSSVFGWTASSTSARRSSSALNAEVLSRKAFFHTAAVTGAALLTTSTTPFPAQAAVGDSVTLPNGVSYVVLKEGPGPQPEIGELIAIRFSAYFGEVKIDDIFDTPEPYYTRVGSGGLVKGVEEVLPLMKLGDRWKLTIPGDMAFGKKGRPASAGKPRIPADATITFEVEMVGLPGKEPELIELIGDF